MNYIKKILDENDELNDIYLPELLMETEPENCFYVDTLPKSVCEKNAAKFDQVEDYLKNELQIKISNVVKKLWLYDDTFLKSDLLLELYNIKDGLKKDKTVVKNIKDYFPKQKDKSIFQLSDFKQLDLILELSFADRIDLMLIFEQFHLILISSWTCFFAYIGDLSNKELIERVVNVEGLYLRPYKKEINNDKINNDL
jgi:hypothetical protein